jgi:hypothetical protein
MNLVSENTISNPTSVSEERLGVEMRGRCVSEPTLALSIGVNKAIFSLVATKPAKQSE